LGKGQNVDGDAIHGKIAVARCLRVQHVDLLMTMLVE